MMTPSKERAALNVEKARENLARTQDLPPGSRVRREAELAYAEALLQEGAATSYVNDLLEEQELLLRSIEARKRPNPFYTPTPEDIAPFEARLAKVNKLIDELSIADLDEPVDHGGWEDR